MKNLTNRTKIAGFIICAAIVSLGIVCFKQEQDKSHLKTNDYIKQIKTKKVLSKAIEDKPTKDKLTLVEGEKTIRSADRTENMEQLQDKMIEGLSLRAAKLIEFPVPEIEMEIEDIKTGPASVRGICKFQKGDKFQISSYLIASDSKNAEPKDWLSLGTFSCEVEDVNAESKVSTVIQKQINDGQTSLQPQSKLAISSNRMLCYPNGKMVAADAVEIDGGGKGFRATIKKEPSISTDLMFPDHEIKLGQSWQIEDENNKANKTVFKFEGYSTVNGVECIRIAVDSTVTSTVDYKDGWDKQDYKIQCNTSTKGIHYFDYKKGITRLSDLTSEVEIENGLPKGNNAENAAKFFRKVTYVKE